MQILLLKAFHSTISLLYNDTLYKTSLGNANLLHIIKQFLTYFLNWIFKVSKMQTQIMVFNHKILILTLCYLILVVEVITLGKHIQNNVNSNYNFNDEVTLH